MTDKPINCIYSSYVDYRKRQSSRWTTPTALVWGWNFLLVSSLRIVGSALLWPLTTECIWWKRTGLNSLHSQFVVRPKGSQRPHILSRASDRSLLTRAVYVLLTMLKASRYRSIHSWRHVSWELDSEVEGFATHFLKHVKCIVFISSWAWARSTPVFIALIIASFRAAISAGEGEVPISEDLRKSDMPMDGKRNF